MRLPNPLHAVIFDMDGTLHDTEKLYDIAQRRAAADLGHRVGEAVWHSLIGVPGMESDAMLRAHLGADFPFAEFKRAYRAHRDALLEEAVPLKPGVHELLDDLRARGMKITLATSASRPTAERRVGPSGSPRKGARCRGSGSTFFEFRRGRSKQKPKKAFRCFVAGSVSAHRAAGGLHPAPGSTYKRADRRCSPDSSGA